MVLEKENLIKNRGKNKMLEKQSISNEVKTEIIQDSKLLYICKTLSRTKLKDYENYVINAVWNRLIANGVTDLKPVSQQFIKRSDKERYYIDLYFPQINFGIECDEVHHLGNEHKDIKRDITIEEILKQVRDTDNYECERIEVYKDFEIVENQIDAAVEKIKQKIKDTKNNGKWQKWYIDPFEYIKDKIENKNEKIISVDDDIDFATMAETLNLIFGTSYSNVRRCTFKPLTIQESLKNCCLEDEFQKLFSENGYNVWFPHHSEINKEEDEYKSIQKQTGGGGQYFINVLSDDGKKLLSGKYLENEKSNYKIANIQEILSKEYGDEKEPCDWTSIVFLRTCDLITNKLRYKFAGIFQLYKISQLPEWDYHIRINDKCPIINPERFKK